MWHIWPSCVLYTHFRSVRHSEKAITVTFGLYNNHLLPQLFQHTVDQNLSSFLPHSIFSPLILFSFLPLLYFLRVLDFYLFRTFFLTRFFLFKFLVVQISCSSRYSPWLYVFAIVELLLILRCQGDQPIIEECFETVKDMHCKLLYPLLWGCQNFLLLSKQKMEKNEIRL